ncbi:MAG: hypothetical protein ACFFG0_12790 [Candidatus Thorarchaeota archaeon]
MYFDEKFEEFLKKRKPHLKKKNGELSLGIFGDDYYDQGVSILYGIIKDLICYNEDEDIYYDLEDPDCPVDPNRNIEEKINRAWEEYDGRWAINEVGNIFPAKFVQKVRTWVTLHNDLFEMLQSHFQKLTRESIDKIIDVGAAELLALCRVDDAHEEGRMVNITLDDIVSYVEPVVSWSENTSLHFLYYVLNEGIDESTIFFISPFNDLKDDKRSPIAIVHNLIALKEKEDPIPDDIFSHNLKRKILRFIREIISKRENDKILNVFLHLAYYGFMGGRIPGIKQGAFTSDDLEDDLDAFFDFLEH